MARRVAVIGGGSSGLVCTKCCLDEGLEPVCFESSDDIGGLWRFKKSTDPGHSHIYQSLVVNTSKEMMCYSDFPMPGHFPNYMHHSLLLQYLCLYAAKFNLLQHICLQTTVISVKQRPDFSNSGQWEVVTETKDGCKEKHIFDAVLVCSGQYTQAMTPQKVFPGHDAFLGQNFHSCEYKDAHGYQGKKVVVLGFGDSAADIAVEISRVAKQCRVPGLLGVPGGGPSQGLSDFSAHVGNNGDACRAVIGRNGVSDLNRSAAVTFLSTRHGAWVMSRMAHGGLPLDMTAITRFATLMSSVLPRRVLNWQNERNLNKRFDYQLYGLMPKHRYLDQRPLVNDDLPSCILRGKVAMKPNIQEFRGSSVAFEDGTVEDQIDAVIFCTGYDYSFSFLPSSIIPGPGHELTLYKHVFPPQLEFPTLAVIGFIQPCGPIIPVMEMQCRWAARVIAGISELPRKEVMLKEIQAEKKRSLKMNPCKKPGAAVVSYLPYMDELAKRMDVQPNVLWLLLRDPRLGLSVLLGPCTPYQYRLRGPGQWAGARQAILTQWERVAQPMKTRPVPECRSSRLPFLLSLSAVALLAAAIYCRNFLPSYRTPLLT